MIELHKQSIIPNQLKVNEEEQKVLSYLQQNGTDLKSIYLEKISLGRQGIMTRLLQALVREKIIDPHEVAFIKKGEENFLEITIGDQHKLYCQVSEYAAGKLQVTGDVIFSTNQEEEVIDQPDVLLTLLKNHNMISGNIHDQQFERFIQEIQNSAANYALALTGASVRENELTTLARKDNIHTSLDWVRKMEKTNPLFSTLTFYEQWVIDGHPVHPCSKTKYGLDFQDVITYSPEWGGRPSLALAAVKKDHCHITSIDGKAPGDILYREYPELRMFIENMLTRQGLDPIEYELIPVHPWQVEHTLPVLYEKQIAQKEIVIITGYQIPTAALVSFRSLAPIQTRSEKKHHIKTAVNVQTTSAVRTVSPASTVNGPAVSQLLSAIWSVETGLSNQFKTLTDHAGIYFQSKNESLEEEDQRVLGKNLASILRENPENYVAQNEISMPAAALIARSPISMKPVILELIDEFARNRGLTSNTEAAYKFIEHYAETSLAGFLTLMCRYGVSLEGHLQNSIPVFKDGELVRMIVRDYGGIRILKERLIKQKISKQGEGIGSPIVTEDVQELWGVLSHSVIQSHLGEMITCIAQGLPIQEQSLWEPVIKVCKAIFAKLKENALIKSDVSEDEAYFFQPFVEVKALASMRLFDESFDYSFIKVLNPLNQFNRGNEE